MNMGPIFRIVALLTLSALLLGAASAAAKPGNVPPGVSGANQYTETLPGPGGNEPTSGAGGKGKSPAKVLGHGNAAELEALGPEGRAAAQLAAESAPESTNGANGGEAHGKTSSAPSSSSGVGQVLGQVTGSSGSGGMGLLLPALIAAAVVGAAAYVIGRRRLPHTRN